MKPGDRVQLNCPDNPRLDGSTATVKALEAWGAFLEAPAAATGEYRAGWEEMLPMNRNGTHKADYAKVDSGEVCKSCGSLDLKRSGSCLTCQNCGESNGCG